MKNKEYLKKYLIQILVTIILFLVLFLFINQIQDKEYKKNFNYKINAILEVLQEEYPELKFVISVSAAKEDLPAYIAKYVD